MPTVRPLTSVSDFDQAVALQRSIWGAAYSDVVPPAILHIVQLVGGVAAGAFTEHDELVAMIFGVSGVRDGKLSHWSDTLAVRADYRDRGLGERLKRFQRDLLLPLGIERVYWTFDPLESRNAHLNFNRLGATAHEYRRDFYGVTNSVLHDIGTDRLVAQWDIASPHVAALLDHRAARRALTGDGLRDVPLVNEIVRDDTRRESGQQALEIQSAEPDLELDAPRVRIAIPSDIQGLKSRSPELAREWRRITRLAFESYFARGYVARALVRHDTHSEYVLERVTPT